MALVLIFDNICDCVPLPEPGAPKMIMLSIFSFVFCRFRYLFVDDGVYAVQVATVAVVVQAVSHDEVVGDGNTCILDVKVDVDVFRFYQ